MLSHQPGLPSSDKCRRVRVAGESVHDQDGVVARGVQGPVCLVGDLDGRDPDPMSRSTPSKRASFVSTVMPEFP
jgi:hypothetical protein